MLSIHSMEDLFAVCIIAGGGVLANLFYYILRTTKLRFPQAPKSLFLGWGASIHTGFDAGGGGVWLPKILVPGVWKYLNKKDASDKIYNSYSYKKAIDKKLTARKTLRSMSDLSGDLYEEIGQKVANNIGAFNPELWDNWSPF